MSAVNPQGEIVRAAEPAPPPPPQPGKDEVVVVSHSNIFYWWPIWAIGFLMAIWTYIDGHRMLTVPRVSEIYHSAEVITREDENKTTTLKDREVLVMPPKPEAKGGKGGKAEEPSGNRLPDKAADMVHMAKNKNLGVIFCIALVLVIVITNVPLRGMWSVVVIILIVLFSVIFALAGWWEYIITKIGLLDIRINAGGYFFISTVLFGIWLFALMVFDRQTYIVFTPGQFRVCTEIGGGEKSYDTIGMTLERLRGDIFRHYILGLGSGDLVVKTTGAQAHHFDLPNVLFVSKKMQIIEDLVRKRKEVR